MTPVNDPQIWTLIGVFAAIMLGGMTLMTTLIMRTTTTAIAGLRGEMNGRFDGFRAEMNGRFDSVRGEMNGLLGQIDGLRGEMNGRFDGVRGEIDGLRGEMNARFDTVDTKIEHLDRDVAALTRKVFDEPTER